MRYTSGMTELLILFVDSLPHFKLGEMAALRNFAENWPIDPGFGYSVNIHAELFAGRRPDELGYFGEWAYDPANAPGRHLKPVLPLLDRVFKPYLLNRAVQRLITLSYAGRAPMPNIPIRDLHLFSRQGRHFLSPGFPAKTIFRQYPGIDVINYRAIQQKKGDRDAAIYEIARHKVRESGCLFVPFPDLDHTGHQFGVDHPAYLAHLARLDGWCSTLAADFLDRRPNGHVFIVSDHGMANVDEGVGLDIVEQIGRPSQQTYHYFSDANLLRVWVFRSNLEQRIADYLDALGWGQRLTPDERNEYGLASPAFGTFIYALREGLAFQPSTFARNIPKGMHGYHPHNPRQQAALVHAGPAWRGDPPARMTDVYRMFRSVLDHDW